LEDKSPQSGLLFSMGVFDLRSIARELWPLSTAFQDWAVPAANSEWHDYSDGGEKS
jgi:hypothetical protein